MSGCTKIAVDSQPEEGSKTIFCLIALEREYPEYTTDPVSGRGDRLMYTYNHSASTSGRWKCQKL